MDITIAFPIAFQIYINVKHVKIKTVQFVKVIEVKDKMLKFILIALVLLDILTITHLIIAPLALKIVSYV